MRILFPILAFLFFFLPGVLFAQVQDDVANTDEDDPVTFSVTTNDTPLIPVNPATVDLDTELAGRQTLVSIPGSGQFSVDNFGNVTFTPEPDLFGEVTHRYSVNNSLGFEAGQADMVITVNPVNDAPVANNDSGVETAENTPVSIDVLANDTDIDNLNTELSIDLDPASAGVQSIRAAAGEGTWEVTAGEVTFTPEAGFSGPAQTPYTVHDPGGLESNQATISLTVTDVNAPPVAVADEATTEENTPVDIAVLANDTDDDDAINEASVDLDPGTGGIQNTVSVTGGSATASATGVVTFTPTAGYSGAAVFSYTVNDDAGNTSNSVNVTVTITADEPPVAVADAATTNENTPVVINVLDNDTDDNAIDVATVDLDPGTGGIQNTVSVTGGSATASATGVVTFTPTAGYSGTAVFSYTVNDDAGNTSNSANVTVTVNSTNEPPVAVNDVAATSQDTPVDITVLANDTDDDALNVASVDLDPATAGIQNNVSVTGGTAIVNGSGVVTFTPTAGYSGNAQLSYTVNDNDGATSNVAQIQITISATNQPPVASNDNINGTEDTAFTFNILANDTDDDGLDAATVDLDPSTAGQQATLAVAGGTITVNGSGVIAYTPIANYNGSFSFSYTVEDNEGLASNSATVTVTVAPVNDAPVANADAVNTNEDTPVSLNVVTNDTDVDGTIDATTVDLNVSDAGIQSTRTTANGTYSVDASGLVTFTPSENYSGTAVIQYNVRDNLGLTSNSASITINVMASNDAPVAVADAATTDENQSVTLNVVANDTDDNGINAATVDLDTGSPGVQSSRTVADGSFTVNTSGVVTFTPTVNFFGTVVINYTVNDNEGATSNQATITITVNSVNQKPVANPDFATTDEDTPVNITVVANDTDDISIDPATVDLNVSTAGIQSTRNTPQGSYTVNATGVVTFTPAANFSGTASIQYTVRDNEGMASDPASITVEVTGVNDRPVAVNDSRTINEDTNGVINVLANDSDADGTLAPATVDLDPSTPGIQSSITVAEGTFTADNSGVVTFVPLTNFFGTTTITYTVNDNEGATSDPATITVTVSAVNDPPIANNDVTNTPQTVPVTISILANDLDVDGTINPVTVDLLPSTPLVADKTRTVASGTYSVDASGLLTFTPVPAFSGTSSINYTVRDNLGATSNTATISVLVDFVNSAPVANDDAVTTAEDTPVTVNVLTNDTDDGTLVASSVDLNVTVEGIQASRTTSEGTFSVSSGVVTFTPSLNFNGTATVRYTVEDNIGEKSNAATISVTVTPVNDAPVANNDAAATTEDVPVTINVIANDTDVDGTIDPASVDLQPATDEIDATRTVAQGTFSVNATTGVVTFTPAENVFATASITYNVRDNLGAKSNNASITVTISNQNDPPVFDDIPAQRVLRNADAKTISITGISPGPQENEQVLLSAVSANTTLIPHPSISYNGFAATATLTFKPQLNQSGTAEVTVKAVDAGLNEYTSTFIIEVVDVVITSVPPTIAVVGETYEYNITTTEISETLEVTAMQKPAWATVTSTGKNQAVLAGTPPPGATSSKVIIQLKDGTSVVDQQEYTLTINQRPASGVFGLQTNEDEAVTLGADNFILAYSDPDNHPLFEVAITSLPAHGTLTLASAPVSVDQRIPIAELGGLVYTPSADYFGQDTVYFRVRDQYSASADASYVHLTILPANDPPRITFLESESLEVDIGREVAYPLTRSFTAEDPDGDEIVSAEIGFRRPNFNGLHDLLTFTNTAKIKGVYDDVLGVLTLTGSASAAEYEEAIRSITYTFINLQEIVLDPRTVYIILNDAVSSSEPRERAIRLVFTYVDLKLPQVFTPDGNGMNDLWPFPTEDGLEPWSDATIRVFDKRGGLIFETIGFGSPWDGRKEGVYVPKGTYFYVIDMQYGKISYTGSVTILREEQ